MTTSNVEFKINTNFEDFKEAILKAVLKSSGIPLSILATPLDKEYLEFQRLMFQEVKINLIWKKYYRHMWE